jgi:hypothetical protein
MNLLYGPDFNYIPRIWKQTDYHMLILRLVQPKNQLKATMRLKKRNKPPILSHWFSVVLLGILRVGLLIYIF